MLSKPRPFIQGLGVDMSSFRAINRPSKSPLTPTSGERRPSDFVLRQNRETDRGQASAPSPMQAAYATPNTDETGQQKHLEIIIPEKKIRASPNKQPRQPGPSTTTPWAAVVPQDKQSCRQSKDKSDTTQAVARAKKALHTPRKKKRNSESLTSKARRQQAPREKKLVPSIEHSARKRIASFTPDCGTDGANESEYMPSLAELANTILSSASNTPARRSPRKHKSMCQNAISSAISGSSSPQSSPRAGGTLALIKDELTTAPESSRNLEAAVTPTPKPVSPSIWNSQLRRKRYEEADFVELPKEVFERKKTKNEKRLTNEVLIAGKRKEKGKVAERKSIEETYKSTQKTDKRRAEDEAEQSESRKRQKPLRLQNPGSEDRSINDDGKTVIEEPQTSKRVSARRSPKARTAERQAQRYTAVVVKAEDRSDITDVRSHASIEAKVRSSEGSKVKTAQRSFEMHMPEERHREQQRRPLNEDWRRPYKRREISVPEVPRSCSCAMLPEYFTSKPDYVPRLATWPGGKLEFFEHVKQISYCRGSIHPPNVIDACRRMLREGGYPNRGDEQSLESMFDSTHESLSTNVQDDDHPGRAQSSIPPPTFYGYGQSYRPGPNAGSSSRSAQIPNETPRSLGSQFGPDRLPPPKEDPNKTTPRNFLVVRERAKNTSNPAGRSIDQHPSSTMVDDATGCPTPPDSSPLGKRPGADIPSHHIFDDSPCGQENVAVRPISKGLSEASGGRPKPQDSFAAQRNRHQSAPVESVRRNNAVNERDHLTQPPQRPRDHTLQELSNNAILRDMKRELASFKTMLLEHLPAMPTTRSGAVQPATAPTAAVAVEGVNRPEQIHVRKRKKRSSAERKLKFPELDHDVPPHLRLPDQGIIDIGRIVNSYERHVKAPYAFCWSGRLRSRYKRLLTRQSNGVPVWTADEINRMRR